VRERDTHGPTRLQICQARELGSTLGQWQRDGREVAFELGSLPAAAKLAEAAKTSDARPKIFMVG
jgi:hypothetical protein